MDDHQRRILILGARPSELAPAGELPRRDDDWRAAHPGKIRRALERALARPTGNWYVLDASRAITSAPKLHVVDGEELVSWRAGGAIRVAPNACPHMGASLATGCVENERLVCPWHGLALGDEGHGGWRPLAVHDDGVLTWVRLGAADPALPLPPAAPRPSRFLAGVIALEARCAPADVIANRLDPWHGAHLHRYSFARLRVVSSDDDVLRVRVAFRILGPLCIETDCTFHSPSPRSVVMTIVGGEGVGSVVETHATPVGPGLTRVIEATLAASSHPGFGVALALKSLVRPLMERAARRLWVDDAAYAERLFTLRSRADGEAREPKLSSLATPKK